MNCFHLDQMWEKYFWEGTLLCLITLSSLSWVRSSWQIIIKIKLLLKTKLGLLFANILYKIYLIVLFNIIGELFFCVLLDFVCKLSGKYDSHIYVLCFTVSIEFFLIIKFTLSAAEQDSCFWCLVSLLLISNNLQQILQTRLIYFSDQL